MNGSGDPVITPMPLAVIKSADFAVCVAVDIPILAPMGTLQEAAALGREVRAMRVLRAIDVGESTEVWLSTRSTRDQHIVIGRSEEDQLEIRLTAEVAQRAPDNAPNNP